MLQTCVVSFQCTRIQ